MITRKTAHEQDKPHMALKDTMYVAAHNNKISEVGFTANIKHDSGCVNGAYVKALIPCPTIEQGDSFAEAKSKFNAMCKEDPSLRGKGYQFIFAFPASNCVSIDTGNQPHTWHERTKNATLVA